LRSLRDVAQAQSEKVRFLLDATLGVINIRQSDVIKIFSVVAFVFLPPTLIASIYGMNFVHMPELEWTWGYPMALGLMVVSAVVPWLIFRWKKWL
jgi:magnesium transporter